MHNGRTNTLISFMGPRKMFLAGIHNQRSKCWAAQHVPVYTLGITRAFCPPALAKVSFVVNVGVKLDLDSHESLRLTVESAWKTPNNYEE